MEISTQEVKRIARLARIAIDDSQAQALRTQLTDIFALVEQMQAVDTSGVEPMAHPQSVTQRLREDRVTETDQHALLQQAAPAVEADLYLVPRVLE